MSDGGNVKKVLLLSIGVMLIGSMAFGQTNQVLSRNAVGYVKVDVRSNGLTAASIPFNAFSNTVGGVLGSQLVGNSFPANADQIMKWNKSLQNYQTYYKNNSGLWCNITNTSAETRDTLVPGEGFWIKNRRLTNQTVYVMGEVPDSFAGMRTSTTHIVAGLNFISYSFPVEKAISNLTLFSAAVKNAFPANADQIMTWDSVRQGYKTYYAHTNGWRNITNTAQNTTDVLHPGDGVWYKRRGASGFTWNEVKPYTWPQ